MDNYDCFISDSDFKPAYLSSPGLSSGYSSADEGHHQPKFGLGDSVIGGVRDVDSPWSTRSPFPGVLAADPCMGGAGMGSLGVGGNAMDMGGFSSSVDNFPDIKNSLSFDDLMDTLWDPFVDVPRDFTNSCETLVDFDMMDSSEAPPRNGLSSSLSNSQANGSDSSLMSLLKGQDWVSPSNHNNIHAMGSGGMYGAPGAGARGAGQQQRSASGRDSGISQTVSSMQQHMANVTDIGSGCDDTDYILQFIQDNNIDPAAIVTPSSAVSRPMAVLVTNRAQMHNSTLLGGVFAQRNPVTAMRPQEPKPLTKIKAEPVTGSCGSILRQSATIPASLHQTQLSQSSSMLAKCASEFNMKNNGLTPLSARNGERSSSTVDMRGGRTSNTYPGLDDHRYTLKPLTSPNNNKSSSSKLRKSTTSNFNSNFNSNSSLCSLNGTPGKSMSILEAFLRSTRPMDPNKGSNAALAAEGLSYLRLEDNKKRELPDPPVSSNQNCSGMLLKKLLTGEIDQNQVRENEEQTIQNRLMRQTLPIDSPLTDGFGLDVDLVLDDSQIMESMNLLSDTDVPDLTDNIWLGDIADELGVSDDLNEILREQTRQDDLWLQHYINKEV